MGINVHLWVSLSIVLGRIKQILDWRIRVRASIGWRETSKPVSKNDDQEKQIPRQ